MVSLAAPPKAGQDSIISLENNDDDNYDNVYGNDFETNRKYLTFSWWLLHRGCKDITEKVKTAVKDVFGSINPREDISLERLSELILEVRKTIEGTTELERREHKWLPYLLPPKDQEEAVLREPGIAGSPMSPSPEAEEGDPLGKTQTDKPVAANASLRRLLDETSDLIDSPTFTHVLTLLLNACFSHLIDTRIATEAFKLGARSEFAPKIEDITDRKVKVAQTLAVFCRQAHVIAAGSGEADELSAAEGGVLNEYLAAIDSVKDLEGFAAVIYSSNFDFESIQQEQAAREIAASEAQDRTEKLTTSVDATIDEPVLPKVTAEEDASASKASIEDAVPENDAANAPASTALDDAWAKALQRGPSRNDVVK